MSTQTITVAVYLVLVSVLCLPSARVHGASPSPTVLVQCEFVDDQNLEQDLGFQCVGSVDLLKTHPSKWLGTMFPHVTFVPLGTDTEPRKADVGIKVQISLSGVSLNAATLGFELRFWERKRWGKRVAGGPLFGPLALANLKSVDRLRRQLDSALGDLAERFENFLNGAFPVAEVPIEEGVKSFIIPPTRSELDTAGRYRTECMIRASHEQLDLFSEGGGELTTGGLRVWHRYFREPRGTGNSARVRLSDKYQNPGDVKFGPVYFDAPRNTSAAAATSAGMIYNSPEPDRGEP